MAKVKGAVRDSGGVKAAAVWAKVRRAASCWGCGGRRQLAARGRLPHLMVSQHIAHSAQAQHTAQTQQTQHTAHRSQFNTHNTIHTTTKTRNTHQIYVAAMGVAAEQAAEVALLNTALAAARTPLLDYLPSLWTATRAGRDAFDAQQMVNATCVCGAGAAAALEGTAGFVSEAAHQAGGNCTGACPLRLAAAWAAAALAVQRGCALLLCRFVGRAAV